MVLVVDCVGLAVREIVFFGDDFFVEIGVDAFGEDFFFFATAEGAAEADFDAAALRAALKAASPAFNFFGDESQNKQFLMFRPIFYSDAPVSATYSFCTDFNIIPPTSALSAPGAAGSLWNVSLWNVSPWSSGASPRYSWQGGAGFGFCATLNLLTTSSAQNLQLYSIDYAWQPMQGSWL